MRPRREARLLVDMPVDVRGERHSSGSVRDISVGGLRVRLTEGHVVLNERVGVTIRIHGFAAVDLAAEVRWTRRPDLGLGCDAGLEFDHTPESRKNLQQILWELQAGNLPDVERRTRTRPKGLTG